MAAAATIPVSAAQLRLRVSRERRNAKLASAHNGINTKF
jgi:hypothetical protein